MRHLIRVLGAAALALGATVVVAQPASATGVPSCVAVDVTGSRLFGYHVKIRNGCSYGLTMKVVWAQAPDSSCLYYSSGTTRTINGLPGAGFDHVHKC